MASLLRRQLRTVRDRPHRCGSPRSRALAGAAV